MGFFIGKILGIGLCRQKLQLKSPFGVTEWGFCRCGPYRFCCPSWTYMATPYMPMAKPSSVREYAANPSHNGWGISPNTAAIIMSQPARSIPPPMMIFRMLLFIATSHRRASKQHSAPYLPGFQVVHSHYKGL